MTDAITFTFDRREVEARPGETISQVARCGIAWSGQQEHAEDGRWR